MSRQPGGWTRSFYWYAMPWNLPTPTIITPDLSLPSLISQERKARCIHFQLGALSPHTLRQFLACGLDVSSATHSPYSLERLAGKHDADLVSAVAMIVVG